MEKSHKTIYAVIGAVVIVLIIGGAFFYYKIFLKPSTDSSGVSQNTNSGSNNLFGKPGSTIPSTNSTRNNINNDNNVNNTATNEQSSTEPSSQGSNIPSGSNVTNTQRNNSSIIADSADRMTFAQPFIRYSYPTSPVKPTYSVQNNTGINYSTSFPDTSISDPNIGDISNTSSRYSTDNNVAEYVPADPALVAFLNTREGQLAYTLGGEAAFEAAYTFLTSTGRTGTPLPRNSSGSSGNGTGAAIGGAVAGLVAGSLVSSLSSSAKSADSGGSSGMQNFGGSVTWITYCTCDASILLDIKDVRGQTKSLLYMAGVSTLYSQYNVFTTNVKVLGLYTPGGACLVYEGEDCDSQGNPDGTINKIGTSLE